MSHFSNCRETRKQQYRKAGYWGDATLLDYWKMSVLRFPDKDAVMDNHGCSYTYAELDDVSGRVASYLVQTGVKSGDFVSFQLPNWSEFVAVYIACMKVGAVANPIITNYRLCELEYMLNKCESKVLFIPSFFRKFDFAEMTVPLKEKVASLKSVVVVEKDESDLSAAVTLNGIIRDFEPFTEQVKCAADDLAAVLFTSGTECMPKGVMLTHNNIIACENAFNITFNISHYDTILMPAPIAHATGFLHGVTSPFMVGGKAVLQDVFLPEESVALMKEHECTYMMGATTFIHSIFDSCAWQQGKPSSLRFLLCGGAPIPYVMAQNAQAMGVKLISVYGATESAPHTATRPEECIEKIVNTDGAPLRGIEVKVVDCEGNTLGAGEQGEEVSRGPNVFVGYLKEPELTRHVLDEDGWYYSGDLCVMDEEGYIRITGRKKDVIIRGGENISSAEIENLMLEMPEVGEVAAVSMPDQRLGEKVCVYVVLKKGAAGLCFDDVVGFFDGKKVAKFKYPERLEVVDKLPRTASGKIKKVLLREDIRSKLEGQKECAHA